jgi:ABC-2 type transport system ATP-binding protein
MDEIEAIADRVVILDHGRVMRDGSLDELLSEGPSVLTLHAAGADAGSLACFGEVETVGERLRIQLHPDQTAAAVLAALDAAGTPASQAVFGRYNLEQLFMALTDRSLRDT